MGHQAEKRKAGHRAEWKAEGGGPVGLLGRPPRESRGKKIGRRVAPFEVGGGGDGYRSETPVDH